MADRNNLKKKYLDGIQYTEFFAVADAEIRDTKIL